MGAVTFATTSASGPAGTLFERLLLGGPASPVVGLGLSVAVAAMIILPMVALVPLMGIWAERKVSGHIQSRIGPNRVGPFGLLQSIADGIKLLLKEDLCPRDADPWLFRAAPYIAFVPVLVAFAAVPFAPDLVFEPRLSAGVVWIAAVLGVEVIGVILAGWASRNKWSVYGAMREACQMVSYEIPLGLSILIAVMSAGTLNLLQIGLLQGGGLHTWLIFENPFILVAFFTYFIASLAANKRAPFDLPESESELVAGYHTEYSGLRFSLFYFAEYAAMFAVSCIATVLFLGAWHDPLGLLGMYHARAVESGDDAALVWINLVGGAIFMTKALLLVVVQMWVRWSLPRPRIDQVLYGCVKVLLPLTLVLLVGAAVWQLLVPRRTGVPYVDYHPLRDWVALGYGPTLVVQVALAAIGAATIAAMIGWIVYAAATSSRNRQRLTEPDPIVPGPVTGGTQP